MERLSTPASRDSMAPRLSSVPGLAPLLSWVEPFADGHRLLYSRLGADGWGAPAVAVTGTDWFVNWADTPGVTVAPDGTLWAHWLTRSGEARYAYHAMVRSSEDGGATWTAPRRLHEDSSPTEHGFVSMAAHGNDLVAVWLDGRDTGAGGAMSLRARTLSVDGLGEESLIDPRTCDCCSTSTASTPKGVIAAWRDRSEGEIRDVAVSRLERGAWEPPRVVSPDSWHMTGCPVNGPAVVSEGESAVLVWYTGVSSEGAVRVAVSKDSGSSFLPAVLVSERTLGRVTAAPLPGGGAVVAWLEQHADGESWLTAARVDRDGVLGERVRVAPMSAKRSSGMPAAIHEGAGVVLLTWTDVFGQNKRVRTARVGPFPR